MLSKCPPMHVILTGVCGTQQASIADHLSALTGVPVANAEKFHPATNQRKLATGQELCTADLTPWLHRLRDWIADRTLSGTVAILTCPPLTREERDTLREAEEISALTGQDTIPLLIIQLTAPREVLVERLRQHSEHLIPLSSLDAQLATQEPLDDSEFGAIVDASGQPEDVADQVLAVILSLHNSHTIPIQS